MKTLELYEPAMCCETGLCGATLDPELLRVSSLLLALEKAGVKVVRANLASSPGAFAANPLVAGLLGQKGTQALPLVLADGKVLCLGRYPSREELKSALMDEAQDAGGACCAAGCACTGSVK